MLKLEKSYIVNGYWVKVFFKLSHKLSEQNVRTGSLDMGAVY